MTRHLVYYFICTFFLISCGSKLKTKSLAVGKSTQLTNTEGNSALPLPNDIANEQVKYGVKGKVSNNLSGVLLTLTSQCSNLNLNTASGPDGSFSLEFFSTLSCDNQKATACLSIAGYQSHCADSYLKKGILVDLGNFTLISSLSNANPTPTPTPTPVTSEWTVSVTVSDAITGMPLRGAKIEKIVFVQEGMDHILDVTENKRYTDQSGYLSAVVKKIGYNFDVVHLCISMFGYENACIDKTYNVGLSSNNFSFALLSTSFCNPVPLPTPMPPTPSISLLANGIKNPTIEFNATATLKWETKYLSNCTLSGFGNVEPNGEKTTEKLTKDASYSLSCQNQFGEQFKEVIQVTVKPDPGKWYQANSVDCYAACGAMGKVNVPSPDGAKCVSGERRVMSSFATVSSTYGCWGLGCYGENYIATFSVGKYCYMAGQKYDNDQTDLTIGCFCK